MSDRPVLDLDGSAPTPPAPPAAPAPPAPPAAPAPPAPPSPSGPGGGPSPGPTPPRRRLRLPASLHLLPAVVMAVVIGAVLLAYTSLRGERVVAEAERQQAEQLQSSFAVPQGWTAKRQQGVQGAQARWAVGPKGARQHALFITLYRLDREPKGDRAVRQVKAEAERWLRRTGARTLSRSSKATVAGQRGWGYTYRARGGRTAVSTVLVLDGKQLTQFTCQAPARPAARRDALLAGCQQVLESWSFDT